MVKSAFGKSRFHGSFRDPRPVSSWQNPRLHSGYVVQSRVVHNHRQIKLEEHFRVGESWKQGCDKGAENDCSFTEKREASADSGPIVHKSTCELE